LFFDLADTGKELSVKTSSGGAFLAPIAADGHVQTTLTVPVGKRNLSVDLTGNVKTRSPGTLGSLSGREWRDC
jgi:hypothetical protein